MSPVNVDDPIDPARILQVRDLAVVYRSRHSKTFRAVDGVGFEVGQHQIVGLVGESGSGKSTVAMAILRLVPITSGDVVILGNRWSEVSKRSLRTLRADAQIIFQDPSVSLDPRQRIGQGFQELRRFHPGRSSWIGDAEIMEAVGLDAELLTRFPHQLSGGQIQRAVIARALLLRPRLLIADEPTSSLDVSVQAQILNLLADLRQRFDVGVLFISHDLALVNVLCDTVHVMQRGVIVESGPTGRVFQSPSHDYTKRLIGSIPGHGGRRGA